MIEFASTMSLCIALGHLLGAVTFQLFRDPLPIFDQWWITLFPLCAGVAIVYKSIKCASMNQVPREAMVIFVWILLGMGAIAAALLGIVHVM
jgi:hypothetical protein